jgi:hypothetical protein
MEKGGWRNASLGLLGGRTKEFGLVLGGFGSFEGVEGCDFIF